MPINNGESKTVLFDAALDTLEWLRHEGVKILDRREIRQQKISFSDQWETYQSEIRQQKISFSDQWETYQTDIGSPIETTVKDTVLSIEIKESTLARWRIYLRRLQYITDEHDFQHGHRTNFYIDQQERHLKLIQENDMYRDLWNEVRNLRALLGETNHWP